MYWALSDILAEYLLVIMVRGIVTNLAYSLASYATISASEVLCIHIHCLYVIYTFIYLFIYKF